MSDVDAQVYPHLEGLLTGSELLTLAETADFLAAVQTALGLTAGPARDRLLRCLDTGAGSLVRRRELARENEVLRARLL